jgi:hypothetical protein
MMSFIVEFPVGFIHSSWVLLIVLLCRHLVSFQGTGSPIVVVHVATAVAVVPVVHTMVAEAMETWGWVVPLEMLILTMDMGEIDAVNNTCVVVFICTMQHEMWFIPCVH